MVNPISWSTRIFTELNKTTSSLFSVGIKDSADIVGRTIMAEHEGGKDEARERFIEETSTSLVWLGGIPLSRWLFDKFVIKPMGFDPKTNLELFDPKKNKYQNIQHNLDNMKNIKLKDKKLGDLSAKIGKSINHKFKFLGKSYKTYKALQIAKAVVTTVVPIVLLSNTFVKMNFALTDKIKKKEFEQKYNIDNISFKRQNHQPQSQNKKDVNFSGWHDFLVKTFSPVALATSATNNPLANMGALDFAISGGRIANARNHNERTEYVIKEGGILFFIYLGGKLIQEFFEKIAKELFKIDVKLSPALLEDKKSGGFIDKVKEMKADSSKKSKWLHFENKDEKEILDSINHNLENHFTKGEFDNPVLKAAQKTGVIHLLETEDNKFILDPRKYIDTQKIKDLNKDVAAFVENFSHNKNLSEEKFFKNAKNIKRGALIANILLSNLAVGYIVPKLQYMYREKKTGTKMAPGHAKYAKVEQELKKETTKS